jgi:hypothetical protein
MPPGGGDSVVLKEDVVHPVVVEKPVGVVFTVAL